MEHLGDKNILNLFGSKCESCVREREEGRKGLVGVEGVKGVLAWVVTRGLVVVEGPGDHSVM